MKSKMFCLRDQKIGLYEKPFPAPTVEAVARQLQNDVENKRGDIGMYPGDFDLYEIGSFDPETGTMEVIVPPKHVTSCLAFKINSVEN